MMTSIDEIEAQDNKKQQKQLEHKIQSFLLIFFHKNSDVYTHAPDKLFHPQMKSVKPTVTQTRREEL